MVEAEVSNENSHDFETSARKDTRTKHVYNSIYTVYTAVMREQL